MAGKSFAGKTGRPIESIHCMADILAVDDESVWRDLYAERLSELGHSVRTADDGDYALIEIRHKVPDLVILDIRMAPSGRMILREIRNNWPEVPVIISSAYGGYRLDSDFSRATAFVEKSPDLVDLVKAVDAALAKTVR